MNQKDFVERFIGIKQVLVSIEIPTPTPWLTLILVLGKSRVKQNSC